MVLTSPKPRAYESAGKRTAAQSVRLDTSIEPTFGTEVAVWEGAAIGLIASTGTARPLEAGDQFAGFVAEDVRVPQYEPPWPRMSLVTAGVVQLAVPGVTVTDVGQPVYATDDDTFTLNPVGASFVGHVSRFVSSGIAMVTFDVDQAVDPYGAYTVREAVSANKTLDAEDAGKLFWVSTDAVIVTLPAIADGLGGVLLVNGGSYGTVGLTISPASADRIHGPNITAADNKDLINTKATARRGDFVEIDLGDADGYVVTRQRGTWAREA